MNLTISAPADLVLLKRTDQLIEHRWCRNGHRYHSSSTDVSNWGGLDMVSALGSPPGLCSKWHTVAHVSSNCYCLHIQHIQIVMLCMFTYTAYTNCICCVCKVSYGKCNSVLSHRQDYWRKNHIYQLIWVWVAGLVPGFRGLLDFLRFNKNPPSPGHCWSSSIFVRQVPVVQLVKSRNAGTASAWTVIVAGKTVIFLT